ncbi:hypothetical protein Pmar_PMAR012455 [Perkinsus marinus ATCC 50983]|uniref:F-box domain-containing protein n=1 Tax=Perkinsus marinus (strain ATCC 50983 / TXsc) TaxID=423536 RepID=C5K7D9_PERM5|nr:hypothetical protein Pmar_PMAR012455 [Perkinsus marinus ATCC 50983]EER19474.1 hypothetical protein Pmar_PMAR012455 [Perkinsus marinus ATCC 50983]|eukprot:XP_002787678.1 hypothetical protein Pmar_PMAR012455 [Perkinsus marinus ATCC 50983]
MSGAFGGLSRYDNDRLKPAHYNMNITDYHFDAFLSVWLATCKELEVDPESAEDSLEVLNGVRSAITSGCVMRMEISRKKAQLESPGHLFERLGKENGVVELAEKLHTMVTRDQRKFLCINMLNYWLMPLEGIGMFFEGAKLEDMWRGVTSYLLQVFGGPQAYRGRPLDEVHEVSESDLFNDLLDMDSSTTTPTSPRLGLIDIHDDVVCKILSFLPASSIISSSQTCRPTYVINPLSAVGRKNCSSGPTRRPPVWIKLKLLIRVGATGMLQSLLAFKRCTLWRSRKFRDAFVCDETGHIHECNGRTMEDSACDSAMWDRGNQCWVCPISMRIFRYAAPRNAAVEQGIEPGGEDFGPAQYLGDDSRGIVDPRAGEGECGEVEGQGGDGGVAVGNKK